MELALFYTDRIIPSHNISIIILNQKQFTTRYIYQIIQIAQFMNRYNLINC